jgi:hypothetical protein
MMTTKVLPLIVLLLLVAPVIFNTEAHPIKKFATDDADQSVFICVNLWLKTLPYL